MINAGRLRHRITLERRADIQAPTGEVAPNYETLAVVWGSIRPMNGREFFAAQQIQSDVTTKITVRYKRGIDSTVRIRARSALGQQEDDLYDIASVIQDAHSGRAEITFMCVKRTADGWRK